MKRASSIAVPAFVVGAILMMVIPVPAAVLDLFLVANISVAILVLIGVMLLKDNMEYSVFPSLLLVTTLVRLALNVSSTRLVLLHGYAGEVIETFGNFVIGGSVVVGLIVFLILIVIQAAVITNGAGRVAEVAARFTLDAMPGKQMAIDADLTSGLIDEAEARRRRARVAKEADFYGAMDGASKFVKGDAIAAIIITSINLIGGFIIGVVQKGMSLSEAVETYSLLSVGDGLDDLAGVAVEQDEARRADVQRQPHHRRHQEQRREDREVERLLHRHRRQQDDDGGRQVRHQQQVEHGRRQRHHHHDDDADDRPGDGDLGEPVRRGVGHGRRLPCRERGELSDQVAPSDGRARGPSWPDPSDRLLSG